jgi:PAS domain-containing protein
VGGGGDPGGVIYPFLSAASSNHLRLFAAEMVLGRYSVCGEQLQWLPAAGPPQQCEVSGLRISGVNRDHLLLLLWPEDAAQQRELFHSNELGKMIFDQESEQRHLLSTLRERLQQLEGQPLEQLQGMLGNSPVAVLYVGEESGTIHQLNTAALQLFEAEAGGLVGESVESLVPLALRQRHAGLRSAFVAERSSRPMGEGRMLSLESRKGRIRQAEIALFPLSASSPYGESLVLVLLRPESLQVDWSLLQLTPFGRLFADAGERGGEQTVLTRSGDLVPVAINGIPLQGLHGYHDAFGLILRDLSLAKEAGRKEQYDAFQSGMSEMSTFILHNIGNAMQGVTSNFEQVATKLKGFSRVLEVLRVLEAELASEDAALQASARASTMCSTFSPHSTEIYGPSRTTSHLSWTS